MIQNYQILSRFDEEEHLWVPIQGPAPPEVKQRQELIPVPGTRWDAPLTYIDLTDYIDKLVTAATGASR